MKTYNTHSEAAAASPYKSSTLCTCHHWFISSGTRGQCGNCLAYLGEDGKYYIPPK